MKTMLQLFVNMSTNLESYVNANLCIILKPLAMFMVLKIRIVNVLYLQCSFHSGIKKTFPR